MRCAKLLATSHTLNVGLKIWCRPRSVWHPAVYGSCAGICLTLTLVHAFFNPCGACFVLQVQLNRPIVPHIHTVATGVYALCISMLRTHRHAQSLGRSVLYSAVLIDAHGQQCILRVLIPPKFNSEGHPVDMCDPVADPWSTKCPNWEYIWRLPATRDDMSVRVISQLCLSH